MRRLGPPDPTGTDPATIPADPRADPPAKSALSKKDIILTAVLCSLAAIAIFVAVVFVVRRCRRDKEKKKPKKAADERLAEVAATTAR